MAATLPLANGATAHVLRLPVGPYDAATCVVAVSAAGGVSAACGTPALSLDAPNNTP